MEVELVGIEMVKIEEVWGGNLVFVRLFFKC